MKEEVIANASIKSLLEPFLGLVLVFSFAQEGLVIKEPLGALYALESFSQDQRLFDSLAMRDQDLLSSGRNQGCSEVVKESCAQAQGLDLTHYTLYYDPLSPQASRILEFCQENELELTWSPLTAPSYSNEEGHFEEESVRPSSWEGARPLESFALESFALMGAKQLCLARTDQGDLDPSWELRDCDEILLFLTHLMQLDGEVEGTFDEGE